MKKISPSYISSSSTAKRQTLHIDLDDPRSSSITAPFKLARQNAEVANIGLNKPVGAFLSTIANSSSSLYTGDNPKPTPGDGGDSGGVFGGPVKGTAPLGVTNLVAAWDGDDIVLTFDWDPAADENQWIDRFLIKVHDSAKNKDYVLQAGYGYSATSFIDTNSVSQTLRLSFVVLNATGINLISTINQVCVASADYINVGEYVCATVPAYVSPLPQPVITLSKGVDYYAVTVENLAQALAVGSFYGIIVEEQVTTETIKANVSLTQGWVQASPITATSPIVIYAPDDAHRWVRVKFVGEAALPSVYSDIADITPDSFMPVNTNPPTQFTAASISWNGNDINVSYTQPSSNAGTTVKVKLVPYINDVESTSLYAYFYHLITGSETSFTIKSLDMYGQFGTYYSKFKAYITSVSAQGVETLGAVISSGPVTRANPLATLYPTLGTPNVNSPSGIFRVSPISNGYVVDFDMPVGATRLEVYEKSVAWTSVPTDDADMVYSGLSPATIITPNNDTRYVIVRYYDQFNNNSYYSMEKVGQESGVSVNPIDIGLVTLIENPIKIATDGSIFAGVGDSTQYPQVFFNKDGIFAYDSNGDWTTEIINSASAGSPTFITKRAVIADWTISPTAIENDGYVSGSTYTGLSASGTYAFWAGADASKNSDGMAKFSVTPAGQVVARKISIIGDGTTSDLINAGGGVFKVTNTGALTASSATITGSITVNQQSYFGANVNINSGSYLISAGTGTVKVGSEGLLALDSSSSPTTKIYSNPISYKGVSGISLWSKKALFGSSEASGWLIADGTITSDYITLDSANNYLKVVSSTANSAKGVRIIAGADSEYAIEAGLLTGSPTSSNANFWVKHDGTMYAQAATIKGTLAGGSKTSVASTADGYYLDNGGTFNLGGSSAYIKYESNQISLITSYTSSQDGNNAYDGPSMITLGSSGTTIKGIRAQGNINMTKGSVYYLDMYPLGPHPRQRMLVQTPDTGEVKLGLGVYYRDTSVDSTNTPSNTAGVIGDLWVDY
jgi:hypothetical protein